MPASQTDGGGDPTTPPVWVLADDRPGNANQAIGVAEALGCPFAIKSIRYGNLARLPNWLLAANLHGLSPESRRQFVPPWPQLVLGAGRRTAPVARWLKAQHPSSFLVQMMWPGSAEPYDLIALPAHDRVPDHPAVVRTLGAPHRVTRAKLDEAAAALARRIARYRRPRVVCLVGGSSRHSAFTPADARRLADLASGLAASRVGSVLVTTSRRTGKACADMIERTLFVPHFVHRWSLDGENPYLGLLGTADAIVVTADSASMCTEACATGRPVFLYRPAAGVPPKFRSLYAYLTALGHMRPLGSPWFDVKAPLPNPADMVAAAIRERMGLSFARCLGWQPAIARTT